MCWGILLGCLVAAEFPWSPRWASFLQCECALHSKTVWHLCTWRWYARSFHLELDRSHIPCCPLSSSYSRLFHSEFSFGRGATWRNWRGEAPCSARQRLPRHPENRGHSSVLGIALMHQDLHSSLSSGISADLYHQWGCVLAWSALPEGVALLLEFFWTRDLPISITDNGNTSEYLRLV
jgi:hypothetical protein